MRAMRLNKMATIAISKLVAPEGVNQMRGRVYCPLETMDSWTQMTQLYVLQKHHGSIALNSLSGIPIQPLDRSSSPLFFRPLRYHQLPLVGATSGLNLRQPADDAFSWLRLL